MNVALLLVAAYLMGAFPTSYIAGRLARGIDLRQHGSGNLGATNVYRVLGWRVALPVVIIDHLKGWLPAFYLPMVDGSPAWEWALAYGAAAIVGHVFSLFVGFRGGKGVATGAGVFLALAPVAVAGGLLVWLSIVFATRVVSVASIAAALVLPPLVFATTEEPLVFWLSVALGAFVIFAHRANIQRLLRGEEHRFGRAKEAP